MAKLIKKADGPFAHWAELTAQKPGVFPQPITGPMPHAIAKTLLGAGTGLVANEALGLIQGEAHDKSKGRKIYPLLGAGLGAASSIPDLINAKHWFFGYPYLHTKMGAELIRANYLPKSHAKERALNKMKPLGSKPTPPINPINMLLKSAATGTPLDSKPFTEPAKPSTQPSIGAPSGNNLISGAGKFGAGINSGLNKAFTNPLGAAKSGVNAVSQGLGNTKGFFGSPNISGALSNVGNSLKSTVAPIAGNVGKAMAPTTSSVASTTGPATKPIAQNLTQMGSKALSGFGQAVGGAGAAIGGGVNKALNYAGGAIKNVATNTLAHKPAATQNQPRGYARAVDASGNVVERSYTAPGQYYQYNTKIDAPARPLSDKWDLTPPASMRGQGNPQREAAMAGGNNPASTLYFNTNRNDPQARNFGATYPNSDWANNPNMNRNGIYGPMANNAPARSRPAGDNEMMFFAPSAWDKSKALNANIPDNTASARASAPNPNINKPLAPTQSIEVTSNRPQPQAKPLNTPTKSVGPTQLVKGAKVNVTRYNDVIGKLEKAAMTFFGPQQKWTGEELGRPEAPTMYGGVSPFTPGMGNVPIAEYPIGQAMNTVLTDPNLNIAQRALAIKVLGEAAHNKTHGLISNNDIVRGAIGAGMGYGVSTLFGKVLGAVFSLDPKTQKKLSTIGAVGGLLDGLGIL